MNIIIIRSSSPSSSSSSSSSSSTTISLSSLTWSYYLYHCNDDTVCTWSQISESLFIAAYLLCLLLCTAQPLLWQLPLPCSHGSEFDAVQQVIILEYGQAVFLHVDLWQIHQVFHLSRQVHWQWQKIAACSTCLQWSTPCFFEDHKQCTWSPNS